MTALVTRPADTAGDALLRFALRADATLCSALGLLVVMAAEPLSRLTGLSATAEWIGGAALVGYGLLLFVLAGLPDVRRVGVAVLAANIAFTVVTVTFAYAQYLGVRRLGVPPA
ncbi:hypothetical protein [Mycolicibacterium sp. XJ879]